MVRNLSYNIFTFLLFLSLIPANLFAIPAFTESIVSSLADCGW